jgi:6-phosphogluconolactonase
MSAVEFGADEVLLVASRGVEPQHGLWLWRLEAGHWNGRQVDTVRHLSSLASHPHLPVVYGTGGGGDDGKLHAWRIDGEVEAVLSVGTSGGIDPCHLSISPDGEWLVATNYGTSDLSMQRLDGNGAFDGAPSLVALAGGGPDAERQEAAHPHQAFFVGETLVVIDLGADLVREFSVSSDGLAPLSSTAVPPGTGPRHGVVLDDGRLAISGELSETLLVGRLGQGAGDWQTVRSTLKTSPAQTRHTRNYPGDIQRSADGKYAYLANRSHDTIATFSVDGAEPRLAGEVDAGAHWPQHILVRDKHLLIAGWDSSAVVALPLENGMPQLAVPLFECGMPGWLHAHRLR